MGFGEGLNLRGGELVLAAYGECLKNINQTDRNTYAVFSGEVRAERHERTVDREPK